MSVCMSSLVAEWTKHLTSEVQSLKATFEVLQSRGQFESSNMLQSLEPNMFQQQVNLNQINDQPQPPSNLQQTTYPDVYGQSVMQDLDIEGYITKEMEEAGFGNPMG